MHMANNNIRGQIPISKYYLLFFSDCIAPGRKVNLKNIIY